MNGEQLILSPIILYPLGRWVSDRYKKIKRHNLGNVINFYHVVYAIKLGNTFYRNGHIAMKDLTELRQLSAVREHNI